MADYYDDDAEYEQDDMNEVSSPLIQNDYYSRRLTDLTNVLYVKKIFLDQLH
jgi:hypothetical protein